MEDGSAHSHSMATKVVHSGERPKPRVSGEPAWAFFKLAAVGSAGAMGRATSSLASVCNWSSRRRQRLCRMHDAPCMADSVGLRSGWAWPPLCHGKPPSPNRHLPAAPPHLPLQMR